MEPSTEGHLLATVSNILLHEACNISTIIHGEHFCLHLREREVPAVLQLGASLDFPPDLGGPLSNVGQDEAMELVRSSRRAGSCCSWPRAVG